MEIKIGDKEPIRKFTSISINKYLPDLNKSMSGKHKQVVFNLEKIEWVSVTGLTFLFGWIRQLNKRKVEIEIKFSDFSSLSDETQKQRIISLYVWWEMYKLFKDSPKTESSYFNIGSEMEKFYTQKKNLDGPHWKRVIPFKILKSSFPSDQYIIRDKIKSDVSDLFSLNKDVIQLLQENTCYDPFENELLSDVIVTELYLNSILHAYPAKIQKSLTSECYFAAILSSIRTAEDRKRFVKEKDGREISNRQAEFENKNILKSNYLKELEPDERDFFYRFGKENNNDFIRNESLVEFAYIDFGNGIPNTLRKSFQENKDIEWYIRNLNSINKDYINEDSKILEYSFLPSSSRNPLNINLDLHQYFPRGLYYLIDIIRRYKGQIVCRSNYGRIVYDFSSDLEIRKAIRFYENSHKSKTKNLEYFPGTFFHITIPATAKRINLKPVSYFEKSEIKKEVCSKCSYDYISFNKIIDDTRNIETTIASQNQSIYERAFKELYESLTINESVLKIVIFDLSGSIDNINNKFFYFLMNYPLINTLNNVAVIYPEPDDKLPFDNIFNVEYKDFSNNLSKMQLGTEVQNEKLLKPIPCILSNNKVAWIGINNIEDEKLLNALWVYPDSDSDVLSQDYKTKDLYEISGNILTVKINEASRRQVISVCVPNLDEIFYTVVDELIPKNFILNLLNKEVR